MEIGWLVCDHLEQIDQEAIDVARRQTLKRLRETLPQFEWRIQVELRESPADPTLREPTVYLQWAMSQRDARGWDYVFVFIRPDLEARQRSRAWACISRSLDSAVISTARIDPRAENVPAESGTAAREQRIARLAQRIFTLTLRGLGHLSGLSCVDDPNNIMGQFEDVRELDEAHELTSRQVDLLRDNFLAVADLRLEEESATTQMPW